MESAVGEAATNEAELEQEAEIAGEIENYVWKEDESDKIYFMRHITEEDY